MALRASAEESKQGWQLLLKDLRNREMQQAGVFLSEAILVFWQLYSPNPSNYSAPTLLREGSKTFGLIKV